MSRVETIRDYYAACDTGDADRVASYFTPDAVHRFTRLPPIKGAVAIGEHTAQAVEHLAATWTLEHGIEQGDEAVAEWAMHWTDPGSGAARVTRGTEWFTFDGDLICEVRAYYHREGLMVDQARPSAGGG